MNVFDLEAVLTLDSSAYDSGLSDAEGKATSLGGKIASGFGTVAKAGAVAVTAAVAVGSAAVGAFAGAARQTAAYGDNIDKMSQKMGMSAQAYQEWDAVMQHSGTSMETMKAGMKTLANAVEKGNDAFQRIGLTQREIASMSQEDLFAATIAGLQGVENETERTYLAGQLLGRGATELGALLNTSAEDTQAMRDRIHELGGALSDEAVKNAARFQDSLQDMHTAIDGAKNSLVSGFLPAISDVMDGIGNVVSGFDVEGGLEQIQQGIDGFIANMGEVIPRVMELAGQIIPAFASAIATNLPQIAQAGMDMILQLGQGIANNIPRIISNLPKIITAIVNFIATNLPRIVEVGIQIIAAIGQGLIQAIPQLVAAAPQIISTLMSALIAAGSLLVQAGLQLLNYIKNGIISAAGQLVAAGRQVVTNIVQGITGAVGNVINAIRSIINRIKSAFTGGGWSSVGGNIVRGIASGISAGVGAIISAAKAAAQKALNAAKAFLGIASPSKRFRDEVGVFIGLGVAEGIEDSEDAAVKAAKQLAEKTYQKSQEWLRRQTKFNRLSLAEQLEVWQEIQSGYIKESKQWIQAEEEIFDLREKIQSNFADDVEKLWKNITDAQDKYADALEDRIGDIAGAYKLFGDVQDREAVSGQELTDNLTRQVNVLNDFYGGLDALAARGVSGALVEEIRDMGPKAVDNLDALLAMTDDELSEYAELYGQKQAFANAQAIRELQGLKAETNAQVRENMQSILDLYDETAPTLGEAFTDGLAQGILDGVPDVVSAAVEASRAALTAAGETMIGKGVSFARSGLGKASAGMINTVAGQTAQTGGTTTINLMTPDGSVLARYIFDPLKQYAAAKGQPIVGTA